MHSSRMILMPMVALGLTACGGGGAFNAGTLSSHETYAEDGADTTRASLIDDGIAGTLAVAPGVGSSASLQKIKVRASSDYQTVYVSIDGGSEFALDASFSSDRNGGGYGPTGLNGNFVGLSNFNDYSLVSRTVGSSGGLGYAGIMTPVDRLPSVDMQYAGNWTGYLNPRSISDLTSGTGGGEMVVMFDVSSGEMDGAFTGSLNIGNMSGSTEYAIAGIVDGQLDDGIFSGTFDANSGTYQGSASMGGAVYGYDADRLAGAMAGSLDGGSGNHAFYGLFNLPIDP